MTALRLAVRSLRSAPAFTLTVISTLALGLGLNSAIFTVMDSVLLRPLGYHDADRLIGIETHFLREDRSTNRVAGGDYLDLSRDVPGLEAAAHFNSYADGVRLGGMSLYVPVALVSPRFAEILGVQPIAGRLFPAGDSDVHGALISAAFAHQHFPSPEDAIGQAITYNGETHTILGVLPAAFSFPQQTEIWFERPEEPGNLHRDSYSDRVIAKRRVGVSPAQLAAQLDSFSTHLATQFPEDREKGFRAVSLQEQIVGSVRPTLHLMMAAVLLILLMVAANLTHLLLVRASRQLHAAAIRTALGASRRHLLAHALLESTLLAIAGAIAAILLQVPALRLLIHLAPSDIPRLSDIHLNLDILAFSFLVALTVMLVASALPVWHAWHIAPNSALRSESRSTGTRSSLRLRNLLLVTEVALTLVLSVSALLLARQLIAESHQDLGFSPDSLLTVDAHTVLTMASPVARGNSPADLAALQQADLAFEQTKLNQLDQLRASIAQTPGVVSVAAIDGAPMGFGGSDVGYAIKGRSVFEPGAHLPVAIFHPITPGFFETMGVPLLRGRSFTEADRLNSPGVVVVNQALARSLFPNQDPLGEEIMCGYDANEAWLRVVGVVGNIRSDSPGVAPEPTIYAPVAQHPNPAMDMQFVVRSALPAPSMTETLRATLARTQPGTAVKIATMREDIGAVQQGERFRTTLFLLFAAVALLLAAVGLYGVTAYTVAQRRTEFGLRLALGSDRQQVLRLVLRGALSVTALGISVGVLLSLGLARLVASTLGKLPAFDLAAYLLASTIVLVVALLAAAVPAHRAASVEPMVVLRSE